MCGAYRAIPHFRRGETRRPRALKAPGHNLPPTSGCSLIVCRRGQPGQTYTILRKRSRVISKGLSERSDVRDMPTLFLMIPSVGRATAGSQLDTGQTRAFCSKSAQIGGRSGCRDRPGCRSWGALSRRRALQSGALSQPRIVVGAKRSQPPVTWFRGSLR